MSMKRFSISAVLGGALVGLPLSAARADQPTTAAEAEAAAQQAHARAEHFGQLGGVGYKAGLVQAANAEAARYDTMAEKLGAPAPAAPAEQAPYRAGDPTKPAVDKECKR